MWQLAEIISLWNQTTEVHHQTVLYQSLSDFIKRACKDELGHA